MHMCWCWVRASVMIVPLTLDECNSTSNYIYSFFLHLRDNQSIVNPLIWFRCKVSNVKIITHSEDSIGICELARRLELFAYKIYGIFETNENSGCIA